MTRAMRYRSLFGLCVLLLLAGRGEATTTAGLSGSGLVPIAGIVEREVAAGHVPGAVVLIGQRDRVVYRRAFGNRALAPAPLPMTEDTIFDLASLTKVVATTTAVMQLVEKDALQLDAPVARYWPGFAAHGKGAITIRQLLNHASGLRADLDLRTPWSGYATAMRLIVAERPRSPPGTTVTYSDINFAVLGELVRRVAGVPLDVYCARHIFAPLGMDDTRFLPPATATGRIAPTVYRRQRMQSGAVHDPTAFRMGGVAGHAGLFSTAADLGVFARMLLNGGRLNGRQILDPGSIAAMTALAATDDATHRRGLGWDLATPFAAPGDATANGRWYGHTGYTGTSIWIDPASQTYVILLTNRVHPDGKGDAGPLRRQLAQVVAAALQPGAEEPHGDLAGAGVATGIDVLAAERFAPLAGLRVGLITNQTGRDASGRSTLELLQHAPGVRLTAVFSPEHGFDGTADAKVASTTESRTALPLYSLYGDTLRPSDAMLAGLDALVFDIQDAGARFYTYVTTMAYAMEAAARKGLRFYVLDRPNPLGGAIVQGPVLDAGLESFTGYFPLPVRHGMTVGELARLFNAERGIGADLHVVPMRGYHRDAWYDETGLAWVGPSPNLRTLTQATLYPGVAMVEGANVSVGRGTGSPFELLGAPWMDGSALADYLAGRAIRGVRFVATTFTPRAARYAGRTCRGVRIEVTDRDALDSPALGIEIASALHRLYPREFQLDKTLGMIGARRVVAAIGQGVDPRSIRPGWQTALDRFAVLRSRYLLYGKES